MSSGFSASRTERAIGLLPLCLGLFIVAAIPSLAMAQGGTRTIMRGNPDGSHEVLQLTSPDYVALRTPEFTNADLPLMVRIVALSDAQANIVGSLIEGYLESFQAATKALAEEVREPAAEFMPVPPPEEKPPGDASAEEFTIADLTEALPPTSQVYIGESIQTSNSDDPDEAPAPPIVKVSATIDAPEGEEIPAEIIAEIQRRADAAASRKVEQLVAEEAARRSGEAAPPPVVDNRGFEEIKADHEALLASVAAFEKTRLRLRQQLVTDIHGQLTEEQLARWPAFERAHYRQRSLPKGELPGESVDLTKILDGLGLDEDVINHAGQAIEAYGVALDAALRQRDAFLTGASAKTDQAVAERKMDAALAIADRVTALRVAVRGVNQQHMTTMAEALGSEHGPRFREAALKACHPNIYGLTRGRRMFAAVRDMADLDPAVRDQVSELETAYEAELSAVNEQIRATTDREKPLIARRGLEQLQNSMEGRAGNAGGRGIVDRGDPVRDMILKRAELDDRYLRLVSDMIGEERAAQLPKPRRDRSPVRIESGS